MSIGIFYVKAADSTQGQLRIGKLQKLTGQEASLIREEIKELSTTGFKSIYIDATHVDHADLSGINEIIHSNYLLSQTQKKLVFAYRQNSIVEKWVTTTGLDRFVETAIIPAN